MVCSTTINKVKCALIDERVTNMYIRQRFDPWKQEKMTQLNVMPSKENKGKLLCLTLLAN